MKQRKIYSDEFKKSAVFRVNAGVSQSSVARELSISLSTLNKWIIAANKNATQEELSEHDEIVRLRKELAKTKAEVEFLKKQQRTLPKSSS